MAKSVSPQREAEIGVSAALSIGGDIGWGSLGDTSEVGRTGLVSLEDLVMMRRRDGRARALMRLLTLPILKALEGAEWVAPNDEVDAEDEVEFANAMFFTPPPGGGMVTPLSQVLRQTLLSFSDGFSVFEEVRHVPVEGPLAGKVALRKLAYRDPTTVRFKCDARGGFDGVRQVASFQGRSIDVTIPAEKVWFYTCQGEENPFYGVSLFEAAWTHYDIKRKLYYIAHLAAQFAAVPARVGEVPAQASPKEIAAFRKALQDFALNTAMMHPSGFKVSFQANTASFDFLKLIDHHNHMMSQSVLAGFLDSGARPALVQINDGDPELDMFVLALQAVMQEIAESWTYHLMSYYIDVNFGTGVYPKFRFGALTKEDTAAVADAFRTVITASVLNSTPEFVREVEKRMSEALGLDLNYEEIEQREAEQAEQAEQTPPAEGAPAEQAPPAAEEVPLSGPSIDDLVAAAQALLTYEGFEDSHG
jgi:hypothetical protein